MNSTRHTNNTGRTIYQDAYGYEFVIVNGEAVTALHTGLWIIQERKDSKFISNHTPRFETKETAVAYAKRLPWLAYWVEQV